MPSKQSMIAESKQPDEHETYKCQDFANKAVSSNLQDQFDITLNVLKILKNQKGKIRDIHHSTH